MSESQWTEIVFGVLISGLGTAALYILNDAKEDFKELKNSVKDLNAKMGQMCETLLIHDVRIQTLEDRESR